MAMRRRRSKRVEVNSRSRAGSRRRQGGFTLIELGLVILIIGVMLAIAIPRLGNRTYKQLGSETRKLALAVRYLRHAAILNGRTYRLVYDLDNHVYWTEVSDVTASDIDEGEDDIDGELDSELFAEERAESFARDTDGPIGLKKFKEPTGFSDVNLPETFGQVFEGQAYTGFYPDGSVDVTVIHLDNGQDAYTLYVIDPILGQVFVEPGYLSWNG